MRYTSTNGCLFYYDRILYSWRICEPTMLFLLGFEAITSYENSQSDSLIISKNMYTTYNDSLAELFDFSIFDDVFEFLSLTGSVEDHNSYIKFNCYGLKLLMNELTGTGTDRTIPIIFKNDVNSKLINLQSDLYRVQNKDTKSIFDLQAQKIHDIFEDADYNKKNPDKIVYYSNDGIPEIDRDGERIEISEDTALFIDQYNVLHKEIHNERTTNSEIHKYIDYKAMYSYALGVLYGCRCLGYNKKLIWRFNPSTWYNGDLNNLVSTAWLTFKFYYSNPMYLSDPALKDKYQSIQTNKLWNFTNDSTSDVEFLPHEELTFLVRKRDHLVQNDQFIQTLIYSCPEPNDTSNLGVYLDHYKDDQIKPIDDKITDDPKQGVTNLSDPVIRYLGDYPVKLFKAYTFKRNIDGELSDVYLSPANYHYYIGTGNIGWSKIALNDWKYFYNSSESSNDGEPLLTINPIKFDELKDQYNRIGWAYNKSDHSIVSYYKCNTLRSDEITDDNLNDQLAFGIFDGNVIVYPGGDQEKWTSDDVFVYDSDVIFKHVLSYDEFSYLYDDISKSDLPDLDSYQRMQLYNLSNEITLYVTDDLQHYWNGKDASSLVSKTGYTLLPSIPLSAFVSDPANKTTEPFDLRYYEHDDTYWSHNWVNDNVIWKSHSDYVVLDIFVTKQNISLYKCNTQLANEINLYFKHNDEPAFESLVDTIFNDDTMFSDVGHYFVYNAQYENSANPEFVSLKSLHNQGITTYVCVPITVDDNGVSLTDQDGNVLVWYDPVYNKYWNGLPGHAEWVDYKPVVTSAFAFDTSTNTIIEVIDYRDAHTVVVNGTEMSYDEFYGMSDVKFEIISEPTILQSDQSASVIRFTLDRLIDSDLGNFSYTLLDSNSSKLTFDNIISVTFASDNDESFMFISINNDSYTLNDLAAIKYVLISDDTSNQSNTKSFMTTPFDVVSLN